MTTLTLPPTLLADLTALEADIDAALAAKALRIDAKHCGDATCHEPPDTKAILKAALRSTGFAEGFATETLTPDEHLALLHQVRLDAKAWMRREATAVLEEVGGIAAKSFSPCRDDAGQFASCGTGSGYAQRRDERRKRPGYRKEVRRRLRKSKERQFPFLKGTWNTEGFRLSSAQRDLIDSKKVVFYHEKHKLNDGSYAEFTIETNPFYGIHDGEKRFYGTYLENGIDNDVDSFNSREKAKKWVESRRKVNLRELRSEGRLPKASKTLLIDFTSLDDAEVKALFGRAKDAVAGFFDRAGKYLRQVFAAGLLAVAGPGPLTQAEVEGLDRNHEQQLEYLDEFKRQVIAEEKPLGPAFVAQAELYGDSVWPVVNKVIHDQVVAAGVATLVCRSHPNIEPGSTDNTSTGDPCQECLEDINKGWVPIGAIGAWFHPRDHCTLVYKSGPSGTPHPAGRGPEHPNIIGRGPRHPLASGKPRDRGRVSGRPSRARASGKSLSLKVGNPHHDSHGRFASGSTGGHSRRSAIRDVLPNDDFAPSSPEGARRRRKLAGHHRNQLKRWEAKHTGKEHRTLQREQRKERKELAKDFRRERRDAHKEAAKDHRWIDRDEARTVHSLRSEQKKERRAMGKEQGFEKRSLEAHQKKQLARLDEKFAQKKERSKHPERVDAEHKEWRETIVERQLEKRQDLHESHAEDRNELKETHRTDLQETRDQYKDEHEAIETQRRDALGEALESLAFGADDTRKEHRAARADFHRQERAQKRHSVGAKALMGRRPR